MRTPAALLAVPLAAGCAGGLLLSDAVSDGFILRVAAAAAVCVLAALALCLDNRAPDVAMSVVVGALLAGLSLGAASGRRAYHPPLLAWFDRASLDARTSAMVRGTLREDAALTPTGVSLTIGVTYVGTAAAAGGVRLSVAGTLAMNTMGEWRAGRTVAVTASLREPVVYLDPGVPDERRALARRGIALVGSVKSGALVQVTGHGTRADEWAAGVRAWARSALADAIGRWMDRSAAIATAIVIGDRSGLAQDDERRLREAGTYHVIAISGGNIAILTVLILGLLRAASVPAKWAAAAAIVGLLAYSRITGAAPSVDRAIAAAVVLLAGHLLEQRGRSLNVLAVAAVLALGASAVAIFDPGFILSFGATGAILVGVEASAGSSARRRRAEAARRFSALARTARALLAATIAAELALAPITAALFGRITCAGLILNFAAIPLMSVVQAGSLATLVLAAIDADGARWGGCVVHLAARGLVDSARLVELAPWLAREVAAPSWGVVAAYYASLAIALAAPSLRRAAGLTAAVFGVVIAIAPHGASRDGVSGAPRGSLRLAFLDVGQGDATLLVLPDGRAMLVDAGGLPAAPLRDPADGPAFDVGDRVVARALRAFGVRRLDTLVLTHGDPDHIGGAAAVVRSFRPRALWEGVPVPPHEPLAALREQSRAAGAEWRIVQAADRLAIGGVEIVVLHPPPPEWERQRVRNDDSVVLMIKYGAVGVMLPGDIGREGEMAALRHIERTSVVVLKSPHHGSATSSTAELLNAVRPQAVIVSAGRDNRFGHPAPVVVARYRAIGATIFSTAADGAVILETDGQELRISGWASGKSVLLRTR